MKDTGVTPFDVAVFAAEMAVYATIAAAGWRLIHPLAGVLGVAVTAAWWGTLHAPKAPIALPDPVDITLRIIWFLIGAVVLAVLAHRRLST